MEIGLLSEKILKGSPRFKGILYRVPNMCVLENKTKQRMPIIKHVHLIAMFIRSKLANEIKPVNIPIKVNIQGFLFLTI